MWFNLKTYFLKLASLFDKFPSFIVVGGLTVLINIFSFWLSFRITGSIPISTLIGNATSVIVNIVGLKQIFQYEKWDLFLFSKYFVLMSIYYVAAVNLTIFGVGLGFTEITSRALVIVLLAPITYVINKYLIFK